MPVNDDHAPAGFITPGGTWPDGPFEDGAPPYVGNGAEVARRLAAAMDGRSLRAVADLTGVNFSTVQRVLNGKVLVTTETLGLLEAGLEVALWPGPPDREG